MELDPDYHRLAQLQDVQQRSGIWWVTIIVLGVFLGNLLSFGAYTLYVRWEFIQFSNILSDELEKSAKQMRADRAHRIREADARRIAATRKAEAERAVRRQLSQTCQFWVQQVRREDTPKNRAYRDAACAKLR